LFEESEGVFDVEAAQERSPEPIDVGCGGVRAGVPQPQRFRVTVTGQAVDGESDDRAVDDG
jgi:hypothetical protein